MNKKLLTSVTAAAITVLSLSACTTNPYTGERQASKGAVFGGIGAVTGAIIGAATGSTPEERKRNAMIGAGIGGVAAGGVGIYMDRQEAELREQLQGTGVSVSRNGDEIVLNMPGNITFPVNGDQVQPQFFAVLDSVAVVLKKYENTLVNVEGHTDSTGTRQYNQGLSERRANSVANYIMRTGVQGPRLVPVGFGPDRPVATNATPEGREQNRRVEIRLDPIVAN